MSTRLHICGLLVALATACDRTATSQGSQQVGNPRYEIRIAETELGANGHTKREVFVFGTKADGTYASDDVVVSVDRASAGSFTSTALTLGPLGATTYFTPCAQAAADCLGTATLSVALAAAPATPLATVAIDLVAPTHVSTAAPCRVPGITMYIDGNGGIRNGMLRVDDWARSYVEANTPSNLQEVQLSLTPAKLTQGNIWNLWIDTYQLAGTQLAVGVYQDAQRSHFAEPGHPGLDVNGNSRACNVPPGAFEVHELVVTSAGLQAVTVSFEQHCDSSTPVLVEGCFRYEKP